MIVTKSPTGRTATLKYLECALDQSGNQLLVDYIKQQILDICSVPSRSELSGGSTGSATNMSTGWMAAETDAKAKEQIWTASERRETAVILSIIKNSDEVDDDISELSLADLDIKFSRSRTYDLCNVIYPIRICSIQCIHQWDCLFKAPHTVKIIDIFYNRDFP